MDITTIVVLVVIFVLLAGAGIFLGLRGNGRITSVKLSASLTKWTHVELEVKGKAENKTPERAPPRQIIIGVLGDEAEPSGHLAVPNPRATGESISRRRTRQPDPRQTGQLTMW